MSQIRRLRPGERVPEGEPKRYKDRAGYVRLRWQTGPNQLVEVLEHRVVAGVVDGQHVHHINHDTSDNRPENLQVLTAAEHYRIHTERIDWREAKRLYESGMSTPEVGRAMGFNAATVFRALRRNGVKTRSLVEAHPHRIDLDPDLIRQLHGQGVRDKAIAVLLGVSSTPVTRIRRDLGLPPHPVGRPEKR